MKTRATFTSVALGLTLALSALKAEAQTTGGIHGVVSDLMNVPISNAHIEVTSAAQGQSEALTDKHGFFSFVSLPPGLVRIIVWKDGYSEATGSACISAGAYRSTKVALADHGGTFILNAINWEFYVQNTALPDGVTGDVYSFDPC